MLRERLTTRTTLALAGVMTMLLAGCTATAGTGPTVTPTPTWTCTPDDSGEPCTAEKAAAQAEEAEAFAEAEAVYRDFMRERNRLAMSGGTATPTPEMMRLAAGPYLDAVAGFLASGHGAGRQASAPIEIIRLEPISVTNDRVTILVCEDGRNVEIYDSEGVIVSRGHLGAIKIQVHRFSDGWRLVDGANTEETKCA